MSFSNELNVYRKQRHSYKQIFEKMKKSLLEIFPRIRQLFEIELHHFVAENSLFLPKF